MSSTLDNPAWWALTGSQQSLGTSTSLAARFDPEVAPFGAFPDSPTESHWQDMSQMVGPGGLVVPMEIPDALLHPPPGWTVMREIPCVQMVGDRLDQRSGGPARPRARREGRTNDAPVSLGDGDVDDMLELVGLAQPGPFLSRTVEFSGYVGIRREGRLVAMAGKRFRPPGFAEVSAVATHPDHRRQGLAEQLILAVAGSIIQRGEVPFLHASASNSNAIRLYESMGFTLRRTLSFVVLRVPEGQ